MPQPQSVVSSITDGEIIKWLLWICGVILTAAGGAFGYVFKTSMKTLGKADNHINELKINIGELKTMVKVYEERFLEIKRDDERRDRTLEDHESRIRRLEGR